MLTVSNRVYVPLKNEQMRECKVEHDKIACRNAALQFSVTRCVPVDRTSVSVSWNALRCVQL